MLVLLAGGCRTGQPAEEGTVTTEIEFASTRRMTVYSPRDATDAPIAVVLHGGTSDGLKQLAAMATDLAQRDLVVFVPEWPAITDLVRFRSDPETALVDQTVAVICALREARAVAASYGGNPDRMALVATSQAGAVALRVGLSGAAAWPEASCRIGIDHAPGVLVGLAGNYDGHQYRNLVDADLWERFDPLRFLGRSSAPPVLLVHGLDDTSVIPQESERVHERLLTAGSPSLLVETAGAHGSLIRPTTPAGANVVSLVERVLVGRWSNMAVSASVVVEHRHDVCEVTSIPAIAPGDLFEVELRNDADYEAWLLVFRAQPSSTVQEIEPPAWQRFDSHPPFMGTVALRVVRPQKSNAVVMVTNDPASWYIACAQRVDAAGAIRVLVAEQLHAR